MSNVISARTAIAEMLNFHRGMGPLSDREEELVNLLRQKAPDWRKIKSTLSWAVNAWSTNYGTICRDLYQDSDRTGWKNIVKAAYAWLWWYSNTDSYDDRNEKSLFLVKELRREGYLREPGEKDVFKEFGPLFYGEHKTLLQKEAQLFMIVLDVEVPKLHKSRPEEWWRCPYI